MLWFELRILRNFQILVTKIFCQNWSHTQVLSRHLLLSSMPSMVIQSSSRPGQLSVYIFVDSSATICIIFSDLFILCLLKRLLSISLMFFIWVSALMIHLYVSRLQARYSAKLLNILAKCCGGNYWTMPTYVFFLDQCPLMSFLCVSLSFTLCLSFWTS
jgi:hypothetical protein